MNLRPVSALQADRSRTLQSAASGRGGFTLVEVIVALSIAMLLIGVASLSITGVAAENELRRTASEIEITTRDSLLKAISQYSPVQLELASAFGPGNIQIRRFGEKQFRNVKNGETWEFSPSGICEPIEIRISSEVGSIEMGFDPLTGCARKKNIIVNG